jgi:hypothetical protein
MHNKKEKTFTTSATHARANIQLVFSEFAI